MKNSKKTQRNWIITSIVIILVLITSFIVYSIKTDDIDGDTPPTLSLEGTTYKGIMTDLGGYLQYEAGETCEHDVSLGSHVLKAGTGLYYATEDLSMQDIINRINCVPYNKILIAYWDPVGKIMYTYPKGPYVDTELITDLDNFKIPALHSFTIISKKETLIGGINTENEPVDIAPLLAANPNAVSDIYGWLLDIESGWVLIPRTIDSTDTTANEYERIGEFLVGLAFFTNGRIEKYYIQMKGEDYDFELAWEVDETGFQNYIDPEISENDVNYMVWVKLSEAEEVVVPTTPEDCGGANATHACIDEGMTGTEVCGELGVGMLCTDVQRLSFEPDSVWQSLPHAGVTCNQDDLILRDSDYYYRAECGVEPAIPPEDCGGANATYACITDGSNPAVLIQTGEEACGTEACLGIQVSCHNIAGQDPNPSWGTSSATCTDTSFSTSCVYRAECGV